MKQATEAEARTDPQARLDRLVASGRCKAADSEAYRKELKLLVVKSVKGTHLKSKSEAYRALSAEVRLKMMYMLAERELCECEVIVALDLTQSTASHHLSILERAGLVSRSRVGKWVFYKATKAGQDALLGGNPIP